MLRKLMILGKKLKESYYVIFAYKDKSPGWEISGEIQPENNQFLKLMCYEDHVTGSPVSYSSTLVASSDDLGAILVKRLDTGKQLIMSYFGSYPDGPGYTYSVKGFESENDLLFTRADVGKTIEITIEPGGGRVARLLKRLLAFFQGGPQYA